MLSLHSLPSTHGRKKKRLGRGNASRGTTAGRGTKGQRARTGGRGGLKLFGLKQTIMKLPKNRGFRSLVPHYQVVNTGSLEKQFDAGTTITPELLVQRGLISSLQVPVKLLGQGAISKAYTIKVHAASASASTMVNAAKGTVEIISFTVSATAQRALSK